MKQNILYLLLSVLLLASCSGEDDSLIPDPSTQADGQIRFEIGFAAEGGAQSRVVTDPNLKTTWETGDEIGLFAVKHGDNLLATGNYIHNVKLTCQEDGIWSGDAYWSNEGQTYDFYAYYPYDAAMGNPTNHTFSVKADQRAEANYKRSDLLTAQTEDVAKSTNAVSLQFSHVLSLVQVEVKRDPNVPHFDENDFTVTLTGVLPGVKVDWASALTGTGAATPIIMHKVEGMLYTYRAFVPAQTLAAESKVTFVQSTAEKKIDMEYQGVKNTALTAGHAHKYSVTLGWGINP